MDKALLGEGVAPWQAPQVHLEGRTVALGTQRPAPALAHVTRAWRQVCAGELLGRVGASEQSPEEPEGGKRGL